MGAFDYLKPHVTAPGCEVAGPNRFFQVPDEEIRKAECRIGYAFPGELATFYREVGMGFLKGGGSAKNAPSWAHINRVLGPMEAVDLSLGECKHTPDGGFAEADLPIFEIRDGAFLVMRPRSSNPNAVYWDAGNAVSRSFVEFVRRVYFDDALFYLVKH